MQTRSAFLVEDDHEISYKPPMPTLLHLQSQAHLADYTHKRPIYAAIIVRITCMRIFSISVTTSLKGCQYLLTLLCILFSENSSSA